MKIRGTFKSKKAVYALVLSMALSTPMTAYASDGDSIGFYEKVKSFIFGEEEGVDKDEALVEFRRQFNAGNNNMSQVLSNTTAYNNQSVDQDTQELAYEEQGECGSIGLEEEIPHGPYDTSTIATVTHQNYGFSEGQSSQTTVRAKVMKTSTSTAAYNVVGATLVAQGEHSNVWIVNPDEYYSDNAGTFTMSADTLYTTGNVVGTDAQTAEIATKADTIYKKLTTIREHAGVLVDVGYSYMPEVGDADNDGRVNLILYDINSDAQTGATSFTTGFFYLVDYYTTYTQVPIDAVHMDIGKGQRVDATTGEILESFYGTFAHEFQHSLFYTYFGVYLSNRTSYSWVNEGLSGVADLYYSDYTTTDVQDAQNLSYSRVKNGTLNSYENGTTYTDFVNFNGLKTYGMSYMISALMEEREGSYIHKAYDYFQSNLVESSDPTYTYSRALSAVNYSGTSVPEVWGEVFRLALGDSVDTTKLSSREVMEYVYTMYMESYMSAGGQVVEGDALTTTDRIWRNDMASLWSYRNGNRYYYNPSSTSYYRGNDPYEQVNSGGAITLVGYPSNSTSIEATHEMAYTLDGTNYNVDSTNVLKISIPETEGLRAYVALYDANNANPKYGTSSKNYSYNPELDTADLYPMELGVDNYVTVDSESIVPHLFVFTYYKDVGTTVTYDWVDTRVDLETSATLELAETSYDFDNTEKQPVVTVTLTETSAVLTAGLDYAVTYTDNTNAGEATVTIEGMGSYKGSISANFEILPISLVNATIYGIENKYSYTGAAITPQFVPYFNGSFLHNNVDYTYTFNNNVDVTKKAYLTIQGIGNYKESVGAYFEIYSE